jgi:hypothetical protein
MDTDDTPANISLLQLLGQEDDVEAALEQPSDALSDA